MKKIDNNRVVATCHNCEFFYECFDKFGFADNVCGAYIRQYPREYKTKTIQELIEKMQRLDIGKSIMYDVLLNEWRDE